MNGSLVGCVTAGIGMGAVTDMIVTDHANLATFGAQAVQGRGEAGITGKGGREAEKREKGGNNGSAGSFEHCTIPY